MLNAALMQKMVVVRGSLRYVVQLGLNKWGGGDRTSLCVRGGGGGLAY